MFAISSPAFVHEGEIPTEHTGEGNDLPPPLAWEGVPEGCRSLALIVDDPDAPDPKAPKMVYVHWVLYNLPSGAGGVDGGLPAGTLEGLNDWGRTGYGGPMPPIGRHRYFFKLYALEVELPDLAEPTKGDLLAAMEGHILGQATLMGTYQLRRP